MAGNCALWVVTSRPTQRADTHQWKGRHWLLCMPYIRGCEDLIIVTDHKPVMQILDDRPLDNMTNRCLLNLKAKNPSPTDLP